MGVVGDVHDTTLEVPAEQFVYLPMLDSVGRGVRAMTLIVRSDTDPLTLDPVLRRVVEGMDPDLPLAEVRSMDSVVGASVSRTSLTMALPLLSAGIPALLGSVGIYGVISYTVNQRTGEIGVRLALGADGSAVRRLILTQVQLALTGTLLGLVGALAMRRVISSSLLLGVSPYDAGALAAGAILFLAATAVPSLISSTRPSARLESGLRATLGATWPLPGQMPTAAGSSCPGSDTECPSANNPGPRARKAKLRDASGASSFPAPPGEVARNFQRGLPQR